MYTVQLNTVSTMSTHDLSTEPRTPTHILTVETQQAIIEVHVHLSPVVLGPLQTHLSPRTCPLVHHPHAHLVSPESNWAWAL